MILDVPADHRLRQNGLNRKAFTLLELLVVLAVTGILFLTQLPALTRARPVSQTARCASNMRMWGWATAMYMADNTDSLPYFGESSTDYYGRFWITFLTPYVARTTRAGSVFGIPQEGMLFSQTDIFTNEVRKCPAGSYQAPPFFTGTWSSNTWNCWIGANFGNYGDPLSGPFYYGNYRSPLRYSRIKKPADALMFMDTLTHYVYSPVDKSNKFGMDANGDGRLDSWSKLPTTPFNFARPTVHSGGANVTLMDGHVERAPFSSLWEVNQAGEVLHSYWYLED